MSVPPGDPARNAALVAHATGSAAAALLGPLLARARPLPRSLLPPAACARQAPLGLLAFGMTTFFLMSVDALWSSKVFVGAVAGYAYAYGGFAQMVAGVFEVSAPSACHASCRLAPPRHMQLPAVASARLVACLRCAHSTRPRVRR